MKSTMHGKVFTLNLPPCSPSTFVCSPLKVRAALSIAEVKEVLRLDTVPVFVSKFLSRCSMTSKSVDADSISDMYRIISDMDYMPLASKTLP